MKKYSVSLIFFIIFNSSFSFSQYSVIPEPYKLNTDSKKSSFLKSEFNLNPVKSSSSGAYGGFNVGLALIEGQAGFAIGAFAELGNGKTSFVPQANYWNTSDGSNFELAGLARFMLGKTGPKPYIDGGLGVNFYNSDTLDFTKLSIIIGGGIELDNVSSSFTLLFDGKYKLIINDPGNLSCFIFTAGMKFPFE
ncbi:MAG TPA: hypothetical protein PKA90_05820 [Ignavibacteria bacterium]|nr:hypothetical protein [Ignavibacteria bacterium]